MLVFYFTSVKPLMLTLLQDTAELCMSLQSSKNNFIPVNLKDIFCALRVTAVDVKKHIKDGMCIMQRVLQVICEKLCVNTRIKLLLYMICKYML